MVTTIPIVWCGAEVVETNEGRKILLDACSDKAPEFQCMPRQAVNPEDAIEMVEDLLQALAKLDIAFAKDVLHEHFHGEED